jgi:hypothetical protein
LKPTRLSARRRTTPSDHTTASAATQAVATGPRDKIPAKNTAKLAAIAPPAATGTTITSSTPAKPMKSASSHPPSSTAPHCCSV